MLHINGRPPIADIKTIQNIISQAFQDLTWQEPIIDFHHPDYIPTEPQHGDRYISTATQGNWKEHHIYQWDDDKLVWDEIEPQEGFAAYISFLNEFYVYSQTSGWVKISITINHNDLSGLDETNEFNHLPSDGTTGQILINIGPGKGEWVDFDLDVDLDDTYVRLDSKATSEDATTGTNDTNWMTPLKTKNAIEEFASDAGEMNTGSNVGTGAGVYKEKVGTQLRFKTLIGGDNISLTDGTDEITINSTSTDAEWGNITGDIEDQIDLINKLNEKSDIVHFHDFNDMTSGTLTDEQHGFLGGGDLHSLVDSTSAGFISPEDKLKIDDAYEWGDHSDAGYITDLSEFTTDNLDQGTTNLYFPGFTNLEDDYGFVDGTHYEVPLTFSDGLNRSDNIITNTDKGSDAITTHENSYNHDDFLTSVSIGELTDVDIDGIQNDQILTWSNDKFINVDIEDISFDSTAFDYYFSQKTTTDLTEGDNLYFTTDRIDTHLSGGVGIDYTSGEISIDNDIQDFIEFHYASSSSGRLWGGVISDAGGGYINISAGAGAVKTDGVEGVLECTPEGSGVGQSSARTYVEWDDTTGFPLAGVGYNLIYWDSSEGGFVAQLKENFYSNFDFNSDFTIGRVYYDGERVVERLCGMNLWNFNRRVQMFGEERFPVERALGLMIGSAGTRHITISSGVLWTELVNRFSVFPGGNFDSSDGDTFTYWYRDGGTGWNKEIEQTQIDNMHYDDGSGELEELQNVNRYGVHWVFVTHNSEAHVIYGRGDYTLAQAETATVPGTLPGIVDSYSTLVGKLVIRKTYDTFQSIQSPFITQFQAGSVSLHNELGGLQGGTTDQYYHLTATQHSNLHTHDQSLDTTSTVTFNDITVTNPDNIYSLSHDSFEDYEANEHIDWTAESAGTIHESNYVDNDTTYSAGTGLSLEGTEFSTNDSEIDHNSLNNYEITEHRVIDDDATDTTSLWSASKISTAISGATTSPAGSNGEIQFNNDGSFGASSNLFWDSTNSRLGIGITPQRDVDVGGIIRWHSGDSVTYGELTYDTGSTPRNLRITTGVLSGSTHPNLIFRLAGSDRVTFTPGGDVGIGMVDPSAKLAISETAGNARIDIVRSNEAQTGWHFGEIRFRNSEDGGVGQIRAISQDGNSESKLQLGSSQFPSLTIDKDGNVGIGKTSPDYKLDVDGDIQLTSVLYFSTGETDWITSNSRCGIYRTGTNAGSYPFNSFGHFVIQGRSNSAQDIILATGTTPTARLVVKGDGVIEVGNRFTISLTETLINAAGSSTFNFRVRGDTDTHAFYVDANTDRVGVGESSPDTKLHVNGKTKSTGGFETGDFEIVYNSSNETLDFNFIG